jgi:hypothetical protein
MHIQHPVIVEPVVHKEVVNRVHVLPPPMEEKPVEIKQIKLETPETYENPIDLPQLTYVSVE